MRGSAWVAAMTDFLSLRPEGCRGRMEASAKELTDEAEAIKDLI
jgi:hypothetical protein